MRLSAQRLRHESLLHRPRPPAVGLAPLARHLRCGPCAGQRGAAASRNRGEGHQRALHMAGLRGALLRVQLTMTYMAAVSENSPFRVVHTVCSHDCPDSCAVLVTVDESGPRDQGAGRSVAAGDAGISVRQGGEVSGSRVCAGPDSLSAEAKAGRGQRAAGKRARSTKPSSA